MSEQVIKLFGKTIPLLYSEEVLSCKREVDSKQQNLGDDDPKTPTPDTESSQPKHHKIEIDLNDIKNPQEKPLKKPDKIIPCPRCKSMETKFCYYNNYNMSQPRHLCKNCQRYWTAGGTMRNIPVGAGRRKDKYPASQAQYRHGSVSEGAGYPAHYPNIRPNGTLLAFRPDTPLSESVASIFLANKKVLNWAQNDQSNMSSADENGENRPNMMQNCCIYPPQLPFSPGFPSPYSSQLVSQPGVIPMPFYPPSPFWGYAIQQPWLTPPLSNSPNSSTLGKGFRDDDSIRQSGV